ncbi:MAG: CrcB family protein [Acidimicrobiia bacterium]|nr:CrcB family protein [Acidimicrobiia bacterium]
MTEVPNGRRVAWLVATGGALGALTRAGVGQALSEISAPTGFQLQLASVVVVNLIGALALGVLNSVAGPDRRLRWGVGFCGAFTTMSGLAAVAYDAPAASDTPASLDPVVAVAVAMFITGIGIYCVRIGGQLSGRRRAARRAAGRETSDHEPR